MEFSVEYYERKDGTRPAEEFILAQDKKMQVKIFAVLELLERNGFVKKTQKTPAREIDRAKRYRADYVQREEI